MQKKNIKLGVSFVIVIIFVGLVVYSLFNPRPANKTNNIINKKQLSSLNNIMKQDINTNEGSTVTATTTVGINPTSAPSVDKVAKNGDSLTVNYTGKLENGTIFDSNINPKFGHVKPFVFVLGSGQVIKGWDNGFLGMKVGEKKTLIIPPQEAYGSRAVGSIPPNSTLIFDVELIGIK